MIDFKNFKIKRGPSDVLKNPLLIIEEGCWYLSTDTAELYVGIIENDTPVLKRINGDITPEINFEGYATEDFVREAIASINIPEAEVYDDTELRNLINSKADADHLHEQYLTEHQDISHLATKAELPNIDGLASETYVDEKVAGIEIPEADLSNYYNKSEVYTKEEVDALLPHEEIKEVKTTVQTIVPTVEKVEEILPKVEEEILPAVETVTELRTWVENKDYLQDIDLNGYATEIYVNNALANYQAEAELYKVDFNNPNYAEAKAAYEAGKVLVLINAAPDVNSYALMNYVTDNYITFTKFLMSRSETYGAFNTYYLKNDNTWEVAKEVKLNKVEITADGNLQIGKQLYETPSIDGLATEEYVNKKILEAEIADKEADLEAYYTKSEVDAKIPSIENLATKEEVRILENNIGYVKVDDRSFAEVIDETFAKKAEIPSVEGLVSKDYVDDAIASIEHPTVDLSEYATKEEVKNLDNSIGFIQLDERTMCQVIDDTYATKEGVEEALANIEHPANPTKVSELENDANYTDETKVLELIENNASSKIGFNFITNITVGHLKEGTEITADMTVGQILKNILFCEHEYDIYQDDPTCIDDGCRHYECIKCGYSYEEVIPADPARHNWEEIPYVDPDCNHSGHESGSHCTICGEQVGGEYLPPTGHIYGEVPLEAVEPTCTETGLTEGSMCPRCQEIIVQQQVIPALGHDPMEPVEENRVEPTTTSAGSYDLVVYCNRCGEELSRATVEIPMLEPEQPEIPEGVRGEIIANELSMYSITKNGELEAKEFNVVEFTPEEAEQAPVESCFYQVRDDSGEIIEFGYQDMQVVNDEMYYIIALPKSVDYNSDKVSIKAYDDDETIWNDCLKLPLTSDPEIVNSLCDEVGVDISHINTDLYTVWALDDICTGSKLRFIITE